LLAILETTFLILTDSMPREYFYYKPKISFGQFLF
jgi:hypothetical protein